MFVGIQLKNLRKKKRERKVRFGTRLRLPWDEIMIYYSEIIRKLYQKSSALNCEDFRPEFWVLRRERKGAQMPERIWFDSIHNTAASPFFPVYLMSSHVKKQHNKSTRQLTRKEIEWNFHEKLFHSNSSIYLLELSVIFCRMYFAYVSIFEFQLSTLVSAIFFSATFFLLRMCCTTKKVDRRSFLLPNNRKSSPATFTRRCRSFFALKFFLPSSLSISEKNFHQ